MICSSGNRYHTALLVPDTVVEQLLRRGDAQINILEMLAVVLLVETFVDFLSGSAVFCFIDSKWRPGWVKGSCKALEENMLAGRIRLDAAQHDWMPFWARVEPKANIAYGPSLHDFTEVPELGAKWVDPVLRGWVSRWWVMS